jgi:crotonobetainyl-CoA:carnitine CoA-transferase CaiB-like acyl-CoA transferase
MHATNTTTEMRLADEFRQALSWLSVLEVGSGTSVRFAGWILAQFGATVTSVKGISWRDSYWDDRGVSDWMNADKRLISLDATSPRLDSVDAVITDVGEPELGDAGIVRGAGTAMPAPAFIRLDDSDFRPYEGELALAATSGLLAAVGNANAEPLNVPDEHYQLHVGIHVAAATLRAVMADGPPETVVSGLDVLTGYTAIFSALYDSFGIAFQREGHRAPGSMGRYPLMLMRCADGHCCLVARTRAEWEALLDILEPAAAVAELRKIDPRRTLGSEADAADRLFAEALRDWTRDEILQECLERGVPCAPVTMVDELLADPHLASRSFFATRTLDSSSDIDLPQVPLRVVAGRRRPSCPDDNGRRRRP